MTHRHTAAAGQDGGMKDELNALHMHFVFRSVLGMNRVISG